MTWLLCGMVPAGVLASVMEEPGAQEALEQGWRPGAAVMAVRVVS